MLLSHNSYELDLRSPQKEVDIPALGLRNPSFHIGFKEGPLVHTQ